jgi:hypothetical protein
MTPPNSRKNLDVAINRLAIKHGSNPLNLREIIANTVVGQMLPQGVVKGGSAIKMRLGDEGTRFTTDLDFARLASVDAFAEELQYALSEGWEGFTGRAVKGKQAHPKRIPQQYIMQPYDIKLSYKGKPWCTVQLEVGHNEIGDADDADYCLAEDVIELFKELGFPEPQPLPLMKLHYQVAQKLHALTEPNSHRAHDLIDLQLIVKNTELDCELINNTCKRLFAYRQMQKWPSYISTGQNWQEAYSSQGQGLPILLNLEDAVEWANELIQRITSTEDNKSTI